MAVIEELIRVEENGALSFGNYLVDSKKKVVDFEVNGDMYYIKTYEEATRLEKNGKMLMETVPGATVHNFKINESSVEFLIEGTGDVQVTLELEANTEYKVFVEDFNVGSVSSSISGKVNFSVDTDVNSKAVKIQKS